MVKSIFKDLKFIFGCWFLIDSFQSRVGGIVSPKGYSFISNSAEELKLGEIGVMAAVKRIHLDEKIARAAQRQGAVLMENSFVTVL
jgi:hypothetical protein